MIKKNKIGDHCLVGDGTHSSIKRVDTGVMYLSSKNFSKEGIVLEKVDYISEEDYQKYFKESSTALTKPKKDDLIFSIIGSIGGVYLYKADDVFGLSSSVAMLRVNSKELDAHYLFYYLKSTFLQKWAEIIKSGSAQGFLSLKMIRSLPLILPPLKTQKKIASILSNYDKLIENNNQRIKLLESMAEEIYKEWFVRLRFPEWEKVEIVDGVPEGWEKTIIEKVCTVSGGGTPSTVKEEYWINGNIPWFSPTDLSKSNSMCLFNSEKKINSSGLKNSSAKLLNSNSFMFTSRATIGLFGLIKKDFSTNQGFINITPLDSKDKYYLLYNLKSRVSELKSIATGATFLELSKSQFKALKILFPPQRIRSKFHDFTSPLIEDIFLLEEKNKNLKETRDLLLPKLIHGTLNIEELVM